MPIKITARNDGFRRCGITHHRKPVVHPDDRFTDEELDILRAEPMLTVEYIEEEAEPVELDPEKLTAEQLRELLPDAPSGLLKADLVTLFREKLAENFDGSD